MQFDFERSIDVLSRTPDVIEKMLKGIHADWANANEGENTWSPFDIVGHLIHGDETDWVPRMDVILSDDGDKKFKPFDRFAQFEKSKNRSMESLLGEFKIVRQKSLDELRARNLTKLDLQKVGVHPQFGEVRLEQLLATWTVHDLGHIAQIARVMAKQYTQAVGPWIEYLPVLTRK